tara:strand:- start:140 stop:616 length:477 start_codon:yes stop_codon:yes gene_type:complete
MKVNWVPLALLGAIIYGSFSFLLSAISPKIKQDEDAQFGYGIFIPFLQVPISILFYLIWAKLNPKSNKILIKNVDWKIILLTIAVGFLIGPVHTLVINAGGSIGQQTMYTLAIIPVLLGSWFFFKESLSLKQWIGLVFAGIGAFLMTSKETESMESMI